MMTNQCLTRRSRSSEMSRFSPGVILTAKPLDKPMPSHARNAPTLTGFRSSTSKASRHANAFTCRLRVRNAPVRNRRWILAVKYHGKPIASHVVSVRAKCLGPRGLWFAHRQNLMTRRMPLYVIPCVRNALALTGSGSLAAKDP
jgi:hypothetical protein